MNFIDAHSHIWTPDTEKYNLAAGYFRDRMQPPSFTDDELMKLATPVGVDRVVLIQMSFYGYDNSYRLDTIADHPERYRGVAVIDQDAARPDLLMRELQKKGVAGFRIYPKNQQHDSWLSGEGMHRMWTAGAKHGLNMCCLINPVDLPALDRMCRDFPETPVVIDHLCRIGVSGKVDDEEVQALCGLARHKNVTVKVSAFYALGKKKAPYDDLAPLIRRVYDAYGPQRLMWATDCPFQAVDGHTYHESIELIRDRLDFLSAEDRQWMLRKTAERVFFGKVK